MVILTLFFSAAGTLAGAIIYGLLKDEVSTWLPIIARKIIHLAVQKIPPQHRDRYQEEWFAHIEEYPGKLSQLAQALRILLSSSRTSDEMKSADEKLIEYVINYEKSNFVGKYVYLITGFAFLISIASILLEGLNASNALLFGMYFVLMVVHAVGILLLRATKKLLRDRGIDLDSSTLAQ